MIDSAAMKKPDKREPEKRDFSQIALDTVRQATEEKAPWLSSKMDFALNALPVEKPSHPKRGNKRR